MKNNLKYPKRVSNFLKRTILRANLGARFIPLKYFLEYSFQILKYAVKETETLNSSFTQTDLLGDCHQAATAS